MHAGPHRSTTRVNARGLDRRLTVAWHNTVRRVRFHTPRRHPAARAFYTPPPRRRDWFSRRAANGARARNKKHINVTAASAHATHTVRGVHGETTSCPPPLLPPAIAGRWSAARCSPPRLPRTSRAGAAPTRGCCPCSSRRRATARPTAAGSLTTSRRWPTSSSSAWLRNALAGRYVRRVTAVVVHVPVRRRIRAFVYDRSSRSDGL